MEMGWIGDLDGQAAADALAANHAAMIETEVTEFVLAAHWGDLHCVDPDAEPSDAHCSGRTLPGTERSKRLGGHGTPEVGEFAAAELAALLRRSPGAGTSLIFPSAAVTGVSFGMTKPVYDGRFSASTRFTTSSRSPESKRMP